jgi:hypothetical protein
MSRHREIYGMGPEIQAVFRLAFQGRRPFMPRKALTYLLDGRGIVYMVVFFKDFTCKNAIAFSLFLLTSKTTSDLWRENKLSIYYNAKVTFSRVN